MNTTSLATFEKEVEQIRQYIQHIHYVDNAVKYSNSERNVYVPALHRLKIHHRRHSSNKKKFEYKAIIISLYGLLERYIEIWVEDYLNAISALMPYSLLYEKIRTSHFELSMKLISIIMEGKWDKYKSLTEEKVLKNLHNCLENQENYKLNTNAFTIRSGNLKHKRITSIFSTLNININDKLIKNETLNQATKINKKIIKNKEKDALYAKINDIVDRRNDIAHGSEIDNFLNNSELTAYVDFLEKYCQAIFEVLMWEYLRIESTHKFQEIMVKHEVWNESTLGFEIEQYTVDQAFALFEVISEGDMIIIETTDGRFYKKPILELQKENVRYSSLLITDKTDIAIRVEPPIKKNWKFYIQRK